MNKKEYRTRLRAMDLNELEKELSKIRKELSEHKTEWHKTRGGKLKIKGRFGSAGLHNTKKKQATILTIINEKRLLEAEKK